MIVSMKRFLLIIIVSCIAHLAVAQELRFVYIAHDLETATDKLVKELNGLQRATRDGMPTIFYLSNSDNPIIAYFNIDAKQDGDIYREIMGELQERSFHNTSAIVDRDTIVSIFKNLKIESGVYSNVVWKFYITQNYWNLYNEDIIASSYFILNIAEWKQPAFLLQIYFSGNDAMQVDEQYPFGLLNLCPTLNHNYELLSL